jgi:hypothetical protein
MSPTPKVLSLTLGLLITSTVSALAQGKGHKYAVTNDRALVVTKDVLVKQGYEVVLVENKGPDIVVWYRRGNMGKGKGKGRKVKMVIHREADRVIFVDTPSAILVDIDVRLKL